MQHVGGEEERLGWQAERLVPQELQRHAPRSLRHTANQQSVSLCSASRPRNRRNPHLGAREREQELVGLTLPLGAFLQRSRSSDAAQTNRATWKAEREPHPAVERLHGAQHHGERRLGHLGSDLLASEGDLGFECRRRALIGGNALR